MGNTGNGDVFIEVPQGCYAVIKENSPSNIKGLLTTGLNICNCIIVTDKEHKNMVLAHVDGNHTNLLDKDHGLLSWIEQIPGNDVEIYYGIKSFIDANNHKEANEINAKKAEYYNNVYKDQIECVSSLADENKNITLHDILHEHDEGIGSCLFIRSDDKPKYLKDLDSLLIETDNYFENIGYDNPDYQDYIFKFNSLNDFLSTQFLQEDDIIDYYNDNLLNYANEASLEKEIPLNQLTYKIYEDRIELNDIRFITENMPLSPVCCYDGNKELKNFDKAWDCLNNKDYKNNMSAKIIEYAEMIKGIYRRRVNIKNDYIVEEFYEKQKYLLNIKIIEKFSKSIEEASSSIDLGIGIINDK